jgi:hypothetical protein
MNGREIKTQMVLTAGIPSLTLIPYALTTSCERAAGGPLPSVWVG